jgi:hypothetical protein
MKIVSIEKILNENSSGVIASGVLYFIGSIFIRATPK